MKMLDIINEWFSERSKQTYENWVVNERTTLEARVVGFFCVDDFCAFD